MTNPVNANPSFEKLRFATLPPASGIPDWNIAMAGTLIIMPPPLAVVIL